MTARLEDRLADWVKIQRAILENRFPATIWARPSDDDFRQKTVTVFREQFDQWRADYRLALLLLAELTDYEGDEAAFGELGPMYLVEHAIRKLVGELRREKEKRDAEQGDGTEARER